MAEGLHQVVDRLSLSSYVTSIRYVGGHGSRRSVVISKKERRPGESVGQRNERPSLMWVLYSPSTVRKCLYRYYNSSSDDGRHHAVHSSRKLRERTGATTLLLWL